MSYLIDTNVISETFRPHPHPSVTKWFGSIPSESLYLSVLSLGEIRRGAEMLDETQKKQRIIQWLEHDLTQWFEDRLLSIDVSVADKWGFLLAHSRQKIPAIDSLIAATALSHNLKLVTRNVSDFQIPGLEVINLWEA
jgi:predicted nucleic acid-binding protein